ncbi:AMP-binding protein, partial [Cupriavidus sp. CV2]|uniref:AMP-binding protein n=1 Tax=Cupriavidus ulmosensis TaxID=3065913 RepID=UPI00296B32E2
RQRARKRQIASVKHVNNHGCPGLAQMPNILSVGGLGDNRISTVRRSASQHRTDIRDDIATMVHHGPVQPGEMWVKSPVMISGYLNLPPLGTDTLDANDFFRTGDRHGLQGRLPLHHRSRQGHDRTAKPLENLVYMLSKRPIWLRSGGRRH